jgi:phospholipase/carboxylesterase
MPQTRRFAKPDCFASLHLDRPFQVDLASSSSYSSDFPHALFAPLHYEPGYAYPLIVWLHGRGDDEGQLRRIMPVVSMRNYVAVAPRGILAAAPDHSGHECYQWQQTDDQIQEAAVRVFECIELAGGNYHVSPQRVFLAGFDEGGTMALRLAMSHPERFAGVLSLGGALPSGHALFANLLAARRVGVFLATGRGSQAYTPAQVCDDLRLLHTAGLSVTLRQYPCGHQIVPQMLTDVDRWIIEQITGPSAAAGAESDPEWSCEAE